MARILFIEQYATLGGGQRITLDLIEHLRGRGHECAVCFPAAGPVRDLLAGSGTPTFSYALPTLSPGRKRPLERARFLAGMPRAARDVSEAARAFRAELLYCAGGRPALPTVLAARRLGLPGAIGIQLIARGADRRLLRWCFARREVRVVTFCSLRAAAPFADLGKGRVVWNWVSPTFLRPNLAPRPATPRVGVLGRISRTKGQRLFLDALLPLLDEEPSLELAVGGAADFEDPHELENLRALADRSPHAARVHFAGAVDALAFLDSLDVLVVPSLWEEPFGLVAVEGMARGLPVVATRSGSLPEIVGDGETGYVVEKDATALRAAVARLLAEPAARERMGAAGRRRVEERFNPAVQLVEVESLLDAALG